MLRPSFRLPLRLWAAHAFSLEANLRCAFSEHRYDRVRFGCGRPKEVRWRLERAAGCKCRHVWQCRQPNSHCPGRPCAGGWFRNECLRSGQPEWLRCSCFAKGSCTGSCLWQALGSRRFGHLDDLDAGMLGQLDSAAPTSHCPSILTDFPDCSPSGPAHLLPRLGFLFQP